jgi:uncharacterized repeat protein (TIGR03803 family)
MMIVASFVALGAAHAQTFSALYTFDGVTGQNPYSAPTQGRDGNLYGTTVSGGTYGMGTVYREGPGGGQVKVLYNFSGPDGMNPSGLTLAADGNFYGTAGGGSFNEGILFRISSSGILTVLYNFTGGADGSGPLNGVIKATNGNFYGENLVGNLLGIYEYTPSNAVQVIYTFPASVPVGAVPPMVEGSDGKLYSVNSQGGIFDCGSVTSSTLGGVLIASYSFGTAGVCDGFEKTGWETEGSVVQASNGDVYDTNATAGIYGFGTIFKISKTVGPSILHSFARSTTDGGNPLAGLVQASDGNFYGVTIGGGANGIGTIYLLRPDGTYSVLYSFSGQNGSAYWPLVQHTNGKFYSTTVSGGSNGEGTIYSFDSGLRSFVAFVFTSARAGQSVQILGQRLTGATSVTFNGVPAATFSVVSDTYMTAVVPSGATTGKVVVTTPGGALTSNVSFRVVN